MTRSLARAGALAAIAGGVLRAAASFAPAAIGSPFARESLYLAVDVCLTAGLLGFWKLRAAALGRRGAAGLAIALAGVATIRANHFISPVDLYSAGALAFACGVIVVSASAWAGHKMPAWVPVMFLLSTLAGLVGGLVRDASVLFVWSGVMFGVAFVGLGVQDWTGSHD
jgi:hypothetical protein